MNKILIVLLILLMMSCSDRQDLNDDLIEDVIRNTGRSGQGLIERALQTNMQVLFTQVFRNDSAGAKLITHGWHSDENRYFYPAGSVRLFMAMLVLERLTSLGVHDLPGVSLEVFDSLGVYSAEREKSVSLQKLLSDMLVNGDNRAFDLFYDLMGQQYINEKLWSRGFNRTRIINRLSLAPDAERDRFTNPVLMRRGKDSLSFVRLRYNPVKFIVPLGGTNMGIAYFENGVKIEEPMNFSHLNFSPLIELHHALINLLFPQVISPERRFEVSDYRHFLTSLLEQATTGDSSSYKDFASWEPTTIALANEDSLVQRVGVAGMNLGFILENAYYRDPVTGVEFLVSAVLEVNNNHIFADNIYEYKTLGLPLLTRVISLLAQHEKDRIRQTMVSE